jgi:hypothetical protein
LIALYERQDAALASLRLFIQETISRTFLPYTFNCDTPHDILVALRKRISPTDKARKPELTQRYQKLKNAPRAQNFDTWLQQWERTYTECKDLNLAVVATDQNQQSWNNGNANGEVLGAFTVSSSIASASTDYHLRNSFILDSECTLHVCNDKERFEDLRSESEDDCLYAGNTIIPIEGFGTITVTVQTLNGLCIIKLLNTAHVSSSHTSVFSLDRLIAKNVQILKAKDFTQMVKHSVLSNVIIVNGFLSVML